MAGQVLDGLCYESCEVLLVRLERQERMHALEDVVVRRDFLVEVQSRDSVAGVHAFLHDGDRGVIAGRFNRERHKAPSRMAARKERPHPL
jgi:hypothetical protein